VLQQRAHAQKHGHNAASSAADRAALAETLGNYVSGNVKAPDAGEPMVEQHQIGASEEEDMRAIEQMQNNRKGKAAQLEQLHENMQKLVH
jgi:hypothetical protein